MGVCLTNELTIQNNGTKKIDLYFSDISDNLKNNINLIINDDFTINRLVINKK